MYRNKLRGFGGWLNSLLSFNKRRGEEIMKCIYNGIVLTMDEDFTVYNSGAVIVDGDSIVDVGHSDLVKKYEDMGKIDETIDADGGIITAGFINGHTHISMSVFRTLGEDIPNRLYKYLFPLEDNVVDENIVRVGARLSLAEMIMGGVTTFVDMYYFEHEVAKASSDMGMRAIVGETVLERVAPDTDTSYGGIGIAEKLIQHWKGHPLITPAIAPHAPYTNSVESLTKIFQIVNHYDVPVMIHLAEMPFEVDKYQKEYGLSPVEYLESIQFLSDRLIAAHGIYVDDNDLDILKKYNVGIIHNIAGNAKSGRPVAPIPKMLKKGICVGFGTDGPMSGNTMDIIGLLDQYTKIQKLNAGDNSICPAKEAMYIATRGGASAIKMSDKIGSIQIGKKADIIVIGTKNPNMQPIYDPYSSIVYGAYPHDVTHSIINGELVMKDRRLLTADIDDIYDELSEQKLRIEKYISL